MRVLIVIHLLLLYGFVKGQTNVFQNIYGVQNVDAELFSGCSSHSGGLFLGGEFNDFTLLLHTNKSGQVTWHKLYRDTDHLTAPEVPYKIIKTDWGYVSVGFAATPNSNGFRIASFDTLATPIWVNSYGATAGGSGRSVFYTSDDNLVATGMTNFFGAGDFDVYTVLTDSLGNIIWTSVVGTNNSDLGWDILQASDGNYIICGQTETNGNDKDGLLVKLDSTGQIIWSMKYDAFGDEEFFSLVEIPGGDLIVCFKAGTFNGGLMRLSSTGAIKWANIYGTSSWDQLNDIAFDGTNIIATGSSMHFNSSSQILAVKISLDGDLIWSSIANDETSQIGHSIFKDDDNNYYIVGDGEEYPNTTGGDAGILVKFDHFGYSSCNSFSAPLIITDTTFTATNITLQHTTGGTAISTAYIEPDSMLFDSLLCQEVGLNETQQEEGAIAVYPNPSSENYTLNIANYTNYHDGHLKLEAYNLLGKTVLNRSISQTTTNFQLEAPAGIYLCRVYYNNQPIWNEKLIKQ